MSTQSKTTFAGLVDFSGTGHAGVKVNSLTTTQRDALTAANGMVVYNTINTRFEKYEAGAWVELGTDSISLLKASNLSDLSNASTARTNLGVAIGVNVQAQDSTLAALAAFNSNGLLTQTSADTFVSRTLSAGSASISVSNGNGVSGNPTIDTVQNIQTGASPTFAGLTLTSFSGVLQASAGVLSGSATLNNLGAPTADFSMNSHKLTGLADPSGAQDATTKSYVDSAVQGLYPRGNARAATITALPAHTRSGNVLTASSNGALPAQDGVTLILNDVLLVKDEGSGTSLENGPYSVSNVGSPSTAWALTRTTNADTSVEVVSGIYNIINEGDTLVGSTWFLSTPNPITLNTTTLTFSQIGSATDIQAGTGLTKTGSTLNVIGTTNRISVAADSLDISSSYVGQTSITTLGTIGTGIWQGTTLDILYGGTNATTAAGARTNLGLGTISTQAANSVSITGGAITGITDITVADGGTGASTLTANGILQGNGASAISAIAPGSNGTVLVSNGTIASFATISNSSLAAGAFSNITGVGTLTSGALGSGFTTVAVARGGTGVTSFGGTSTLLYTTTANTLSSITTANNGVLVTDGSGVPSISSSLPSVITLNGNAIYTASGTDVAITDGGTGASTATTAFDNLAPTTTAGDIIYHNGTDNIRLGIGSPGNVLTVNGGGTAPSWIAASGSSNLTVATKTANYTVTTSDQLLLADATSGGFTFTMPTAVGNSGKTIWFKRIDNALTNLVIIDGSGSETIDGSLTVTLYNSDQVYQFVSDNSNWQLIINMPYDENTYRAKGSTLNRWYSASGTGIAPSAASFSINTLRAIPVVMGKTTTIDQMAINVTVLGASSNARVGIYADNGNLYPGALIVDAGSIATATTGVKTFTTGLPITLLPGLYWLAIVGNGTAPTIRSLAPTGVATVLGLDSALGTAFGTSWTVAFTFATLPSTFTAGGTVFSGAPPAVFFRQSA